MGRILGSWCYMSLLERLVMRLVISCAAEAAWILEHNKDEAVTGSCNAS
jgi:hypothetical protein